MLAHMKNSRFGFLCLLVCGVFITDLFASPEVSPDGSTPTVAIPTSTPKASLGLTPSTQSSPEATSKPMSPAEAALETARDLKYLEDLRAQIKGHGQDPAETIFKDIQILKGKPAGAVLSIMETAYNKSLGVHCSYCHNPQDWAADAKMEKTVTRQMNRMVQDINQKYLKSMDTLRSHNPVVNCTTCHRGQEKPALDLEPTPKAHP